MSRRLAGKLHSVTTKCEENPLCPADRRCSSNSFLQLGFFQCKICRKCGWHYLVETKQTTLSMQVEHPYRTTMDLQLGAFCCKLTLDHPMAVLKIYNSKISKTNSIFKLEIWIVPKVRIVDNSVAHLQYKCEIETINRSSPSGQSGSHKCVRTISCGKACQTCCFIPHNRWLAYSLSHKELWILIVISTMW